MINRETRFYPRTPEFLEFKDAWPKGHWGKPNDAAKAWMQTESVRPPLPELLAGLAHCKASEQWGRDGGQYIPLPSTWLRDMGWESQLKPAQVISAARQLTPDEQQAKADAEVQRFNRLTGGKNNDMATH